VKNATIRLIGTDGTMLRLNADKGKFKFRLNPESDYVVAAFKKGYLNAKAKETTIGLKDSKTFDVRLALTPTDAPIRVDNIYFDFGKWDLLPASKDALDSLVQILVQNPTVTIELMAHTDCRGDAQFNFELSQKRAESVVNYLVANGISPARLVAKGYGETAPKTVTRKLAEKYSFLKKGEELTCDFINQLPTEEEQEICHQINRRTEFRVLSTDYREKFAPSPKE
jgi:peptidoglycan-associated lipoprotein